MHWNRNRDLLFIYWFTYFQHKFLVWLIFAYHHRQQKPGEQERIITVLTHTSSYPHPILLWLWLWLLLLVYSILFWVVVLKDNFMARYYCAKKKKKKKKKLSRYTHKLNFLTKEIDVPPVPKCQTWDITKPKINTPRPPVTTTLTTTTTTAS